MRAGPSVRSDVVGNLTSGSSVHVTGRVIGADWYQVKTEDGTTGYVYADLLKETAPPAPAPSAPPAMHYAPAPTASSPPSPPPAHAAGTSAAGSPGAGTFRDCDGCPEMIAIKPGSFVMGTNTGDRSEGPAHRVTISEPYAIGRFEVTLGEWKQCASAGGCSFTPKTAGTDDQTPIRDVSWVNAQEYVRWLSAATGKHYRLPTEAEWEYAARAGTSTRYWWGEKMASGKANCKDCGGAWNVEEPAEVGSFEPNPFGLYDVSGSVWEWVADCWHKDYDGAPTDGKVWEDRGCQERVIRGGSWRNDSTYMHSPSRFYYDADVRYLLNGFRVARDM